MAASRRRRAPRRAVSAGTPGAGGGAGRGAAPVARHRVAPNPNAAGKCNAHRPVLLGCPCPRPLTCIASELSVARHVLSPKTTVLATRVPIHRATIPAARAACVLWQSTLRDAVADGQRPTAACSRLSSAQLPTMPSSRPNAVLQPLHEVCRPAHRARGGVARMAGSPVLAARCITKGTAGDRHVQRRQLACVPCPVPCACRRRTEEAMHAACSFLSQSVRWHPADPTITPRRLLGLQKPPMPPSQGRAA